MVLKTIPIGVGLSIAEGVKFINDAIEAAEQAKIDSTTAISTSTSANQTANTALNNSESTQTQLDTVIIESGTSDAETLEARTNVAGKSFNVLTNRLDDIEKRDVDVTWFGASGSDQKTTGSISSGSTSLVVFDAIDFKVGQGIKIKSAGDGSTLEVASLQITSDVTTDGNAVVSLDGVSTNIAVVTGETAIQVADKIRATSFAGWTTGGTAGTDTVTFTANNHGDKQDATYTDNGTGATGTTTTTTQGVSVDLVTEITAISGTTVTVADSAFTTVSNVTISHEDSTAIQSAIDFAMTYSIEELFTPPGYYNTQTLTSADKVTFVGDNVTFSNSSYKTESLNKHSSQMMENAVQISSHGAKSDGIDYSVELQNAVDEAASKNIDLEARNGIFNGSFLVKGPIIGNPKFKGTLTLDTHTGLDWRLRELKNIEIDNVDKTINAFNFYEPFSGRYRFDNCKLYNNDIAIFKEFGNIGNYYIGTAFRYNNYGIKAYSVNAPIIMHVGADTIERCYFSSNLKAAIFIDSPQIGTGQFTIRDSVIERGGMGIFVKNFRSAFNPLVLDNVWFENNSIGTVDIDGIVYDKKDIYLINTDSAVIRDSKIPKIKLVNSALSIDNCHASIDFSTYDIDTISKVVATNMVYDGGIHPLITYSLKDSLRGGHGTAGFYSPSRKLKINESKGNVLVSETYADKNSVSFLGTTTVTGYRVRDGINFNTCLEITIPNGNTNLGPVYSNIVGKTNVTTFSVKLVGGSTGGLEIRETQNGSSSPEFSSLLKINEFVNVCSVSTNGIVDTSSTLLIANNTGAPVTLRFAERQVIEFDKKSEAIDFYNGMSFVTNGVMTDVTDSIPTYNTWEVGDKLYNSSPTSGSYMGWTCVTAGTPGTWKGFGLIEA